MTDEHPKAFVTAIDDGMAAFSEPAAPSESGRALVAHTSSRHSKVRIQRMCFLSFARLSAIRSCCFLASVSPLLPLASPSAPRPSPPPSSAPPSLVVLLDWLPFARLRFFCSSSGPCLRSSAQLSPWSSSPLHARPWPKERTRALAVLMPRLLLLPPPPVPSSSDSPARHCAHPRHWGAIQCRAGVPSCQPAVLARKASM